MNEKILKHLTKFCGDNGFDFDGSSGDILETLQDSGEEVYSRVTRSARWWDETFEVVDVDGMLIGFNGAITTGDSNADELGWEFDAESCCEVEKHTETKVITKYIKKGEQHVENK